MRGIFSKVSMWKVRGEEDPNQRQKSRINDHSAANISLAAQMLYDCIHGTLSNGVALRGDDMSGFTSLLEALSSKPPEDLNQWRYAQDTTEFLDVLLSYKHHPEFIETCNQRNLGEALINALRLLRMLEIKQVGSNETDGRGVSYVVSEKLCEIFGVLCSSIQTVEAMRPVLTKLFCLPLQAFPESGIHLQRHIASVIAILCRYSLSSQIVWFLHESQAIKFMVRSLQELVTLDLTSQSGQAKSTTLKGFPAEERELWLVAFESFANLLAASYQFSSVLVGDLDAADGVSILVQIIVYSRGERCMKTVSLLFELLIGEIESKEGGGVASKTSELSKIAPIFRGVLKGVLRLEQSLQGDETVEHLINISSDLQMRRDEIWKDVEGENILQSLAFGFLTLCSSHIQTYVLLEQSHHFFATILLSIPAFLHIESLVAVAKTLVFVGGEGRPSFEILSFCAAISVMINGAFGISDIGGVSSGVKMELLPYILSILDDVLHGDRKHCLIFSCCALKPMIYEPLGIILETGPEAETLKPTSIPNFPVLCKLLQLLRTSLKQNAFSVMTDIRNSGLLDIFVVLMCSAQYHSVEVLEFLEIPVLMLLSDQDVELEYVLANICDLVLRLLQNKNYSRIAHVLKRLEYSMSTVAGTSHSFAVHKAWQYSKGFECLMCVLASLDGVFASATLDGSADETATVIVDSSLELHIDCLHRIFAVFSVCLTNPMDSYMFSYQNKSNRNYFKDKIGYSNLASGLKCSGVLLSQHVENVLNDILGLVAGRVDSNNPRSCAHISNPEAMVTLIDILSYLRTDLAKVAIDLIEQTAAIQIDGSQVLVEAGITRHILNTFCSVLANEMHPLRENILQLLILLCSEHLVLGDFASVVRNLVRPELVVSPEDRLLLPPWHCFDTSGSLQSRSWYSVQLLNTLLKRTIRQQGTSYVSIGSEASYRPTEYSYLSVSWSDVAMGKPFPIYGLATSAWFQIEEKAAMKQRFDSSAENCDSVRSGSILPLITFVSSVMGVFLELHIDVQQSSGRIIYRKSKGVGVSLFNVPYISEGDWHLCNVTMKRAKRLLATKTSVVVFLDGQAIFNDTIDIDAPTTGSVEVAVGKKIYGSADFDDSSGWGITADKTSDTTVLHDFLQASSAPQFAVALWRLGTFCVFEEYLTQSQISQILNKGPSYHGNFQGESPLVDMLPTFVTSTLCKCNASLFDLSAQLDAMSLRAVESVVVPAIDYDDSSKLIGGQIEMPSLPAPVLVYSGASFVKNHSLALMSHSDGKINFTPPTTPSRNVISGISRKRISESNIDSKRLLSNDPYAIQSYNTGMPKLALNNLAVDTSSYPQAELCNGYHVSRVESVSRCVAAIGGPAALMPFVQAASTEAHLLMALSLVRNASRSDSVNLKYMQTGGYQLLSFLLTLKPKKLITDAVVESLFLFAIDKGSHMQPEKLSRSNDFRSLLVDTQALYHLILNHQVWGAERYNVAFVVVDLIRGLVSEDAHHAALNAKRLSLLGVGRWLLFLMVYGSNKALNKCEVFGESGQSPESTPEKVHIHNGGAESFLGECEVVVWNISCRPPSEMAGRRDASDPFLILCLAVVRPLLMCRLRSKDVELLAHLVTNSLYSVDDVYNVTESSANNTAINSRDHRIFTSTNINVTPAVSTRFVSTDGREKSADESIDSLFPPNLIRTATQQSLKAENGMSICDHLSPIAMMRVALIRFLKEVYVRKIEHLPETALNSGLNLNSSNTESSDAKIVEDTAIKQIFSKTLTPMWFFSSLAKATDIAATAELLRLLFLQMQYDTQFNRAFCGANGMIILNRLFSDEPTHVAVILPILGFFLNVPMSKVPLPVTQCDVSLIQLLNTTEGPSLSTPEVSEVFIPAFDTIMTQFSVHARHKAAGSVSVSLSDGNPSDLIRAVLIHAMSNCPLLREFMQIRFSINTIILSLLRCSDAMEDFGTRVYVTDLSSAINDNYLDGTTCTICSRDRNDYNAHSDEPKGNLYLENSDKINLILPEASCVLNIIRCIISDSIKFFQNPQVIALLLLAFPPLVSDVYIFELHKLVIDQLAVIAKSMYVEMNLDFIATVVKIFTFIIPIAKARLLGDEVLLQILQLIFVLIDMLTFMEKNFIDDSDKFDGIQKEFVCLARYFSIISISAMRSMETNAPNNDIKTNMLQLVRSHLHILYYNMDDELPLPAKARGLSQDSVIKGVAVLDSFQLSIQGSEQANISLIASARSKRIALFNTTLSLVQNEINKLSGFFSAYVFLLLHPLFLDDNYNIRVESMRIIAAIMHYRRSVFFGIVRGPNKDSNDSTTIYGDINDGEIGAMDGYSKLLPTSAKVLQIALKLYSGGSTSHQREVDDGEDSRFADFIYWLSSTTSYRYDIPLGYLENCFGGNLPSIASVSDVLKKVQGSRVISEFHEINTESVSVNSMLYAGPAMLSIKFVFSEMTHWSLYGIADSASGARAWNNGWMALQCSPIWGALPLSSSDNIAPPGSKRVGWRLGYLEGPEKIRARMEEDFGTSLADGYQLPVADVCISQSKNANYIDTSTEPAFELKENSDQAENTKIHDELIAKSMSLLHDTDSENSTLFSDLLKQIQKSGGLRRHQSLFGEGNSELTQASLSPHAAVDAEAVDVDDFFAEENSMSVEYTNTGDVSLPLSPAAISTTDESEFHTPLKTTSRAVPRYSFGGEEDEHAAELERYYDAVGAGIEEYSPVVANINNGESEDYVDQLKESNQHLVQFDVSKGQGIAEDISDDNRPIIGGSSGADRFERFKDGVVTRMSSLVSRDSNISPGPSLKEMNRKISIRFSSAALAGVLGTNEGNNSVVMAGSKEAIAVKKRGVGTENQESLVLENSLLPGLAINNSIGASVIKNPYEMDESSRKFHLLNEIMKGLIGSHEWVTGQTLNIDRIFGLESHPALLVLTPRFVHLLDGFQLIQSTGSSDKLIEWTSLTGRINITTSFSAPVMSSSVKGGNEGDGKEVNKWQTGGPEEILWLRQIWKQFLRDDIGYFRIPIDDIYSVFRRRYQLQDKALEITSCKGFSLLFACKSRLDCDVLLKKLLETDMSNSMFRIAGLNNIQLGVGLFPYRRVIAYYISYVQKLWLKGYMSNFEYLMHLNTAAGRSFQDLTQYPVFPWILSDYTSTELDLNNSNSFRDLAKPMGALGEKRALQYKERFRTMHELLVDEQEGHDVHEGGVTSTPPFFYGTHYSCAGYVLHYLMRMQPFSGMAINLQGGQFDKPDRLFRSIEQSWSSASQDNLQDVRELVPEFFFLPDFLTNSNKFELGMTQKGEKIDDVILPPWANNSPAEFIKKHREALESRYVSENLHNWIDLIFGYKQLGKEAEDAMNVFIHLTYEGEVDVDTIQDEIIKEATIAQINNFGQTPTRLFQKPHPKKIIPAIWKPNPLVEGQLLIDSDSVNYFVPMAPPFSVVGASHLTDICKVYFGQAAFPPQMNSKPTGPIGDLRVIGRDKVVAVPSGCCLVPSKYTRYIRYWRPSGSISLHPSQPPIRLDPDRDAEIHDSLHSRPVSCVSVSSDGNLIATGSEDRSVRLWAMPKAGSHSKRLHHLTTFAGHSGSIICLDISVKLSIVVSGSADKSAMIWDIHNLKLLHVLGNFQGPVCSVSINQLSGNVAALSNDRLSLFDINGHLITFMSFSDVGLTSNMPAQLSSPGEKLNQPYPNYINALKAKPRVVAAPSCADWQDGVVAITGHEGGYIFLWKIVTEPAGVGSRRSYTYQCTAADKLRKILVPFGTLRTHRADISVIRLCHWNIPKLRPLITRQFEGENGLEMLVGDVDGYVSRWDASRIDQMSQTEITALTARHQSAVSLFSSVMLAPNREIIDFGPKKQDYEDSIESMGLVKRSDTSSFDKLVSNSSGNIS